MVNMKGRLRNPNYANSPSFARAYMMDAADRIAALEAQLAEAKAENERLKIGIEKAEEVANKLLSDRETQLWHRFKEMLSALGAAPPAPMVTECKTEGCAQPATVRFERGGVGSDYCHICYMRIQALTANPR